MELENTKKKIAVMKKAVLKERTGRQSDMTELDQLQKAIPILEQSSQEKDSQILSFNSEKEVLESQLSDMRQKNRQGGFFTPRRATKQNLVLMERQNKKLIEDYHFLKQENADLENMLATISSEMATTVETPEESSLSKAKTSLLQTLEISTKQKESIESDFKDAQFSNNNLKDTGNRCEREINSLKQSLKSAEDEIEMLNRFIEQKQGIIATLSEKLLKHAENEGKLSGKLMQYKNELADSEKYFQKYEVLKINNLINHNASITLKQDHIGDFVIEIEDKRNRILHPLREIERIARHPHSETRFFVKFSDNSQVEFQATDPESLVNKMVSFLERVLNS